MILSQFFSYKYNRSCIRIINNHTILFTSSTKEDSKRVGLCLPRRKALQWHLMWNLNRMQLEPFPLIYIFLIPLIYIFKYFSWNRVIWRLLASGAHSQGRTRALQENTVGDSSLQWWDWKKIINVWILKVSLRIQNDANFKGADKYNGDFEDISTDLLLPFLFHCVTQPCWGPLSIILQDKSSHDFYYLVKPVLSDHRHKIYDFYLYFCYS
jgi:hypothetical protein